MSICEYPDYKGSNLPYIDLVPSHWTLKKIAWDIPYSVGWTPPSGNEDYYDGDIPWVTIGDLEKQSIKSTKSTITELAVDVRKAKPVPSGSLLFSFKLSVGKVTFAEIECFTNEAIAAFEPNKTVILSYWYYASPLIIPHYGRDNIYGAKLLNQDLIGSVKFYCPSKTEQQKIAQFLDYETAKIDALIDEQKRLIELLKEKRQAVISHAVTKGLNPDAPMKDSGVVWLGEVPEHWEVKKLKWLFEIKKNIAGKLGYDVLSITQKGIIIKDIESGDGQLASDYAKYQIVEVGDFAMNQMDLVTGFVDISNYNGVTSPDYRVFNLREPEASEPRFFLRIFQNAYHQRIFFPLGQGAAHLGRWRLPREGFDNFEIAVPPINEQEEIARFIDSEHEKLGRLTEESRKQVDLLQERRSALISAAVTGKVNVRDWQPPAGSDTVDSNASVQTERHYG